MLAVTKELTLHIFHNTQVPPIFLSGLGFPKAKGTQPVSLSYCNNQYHF